MKNDALAGYVGAMALQDVLSLLPPNPNEIHKHDVPKGRAAYIQYVIQQFSKVSSDTLWVVADEILLKCIVYRPSGLTELLPPPTLSEIGQMVGIAERTVTELECVRSVPR